MAEGLQSKKEYATAVKKNYIKLNRTELTEMKDNSGKKADAKICLNSVRDMLGERLNMIQTKYITDLCEFYKILLDNKLHKTMSVSLMMIYPA